MTTAVAPVDLLSKEAYALLHEHRSEIVAVDVVPDSGGHTRWNVVASRTVPPALVVVARLLITDAIRACDDAKTYLLTLRMEMTPEEVFAVPGPRRKKIEAIGRNVFMAKQLLDEKPHLDPLVIKSKIRVRNESLRQHTLKEISEMRLVPEGAWSLLGARIRRPELVRWRGKGRDKRNDLYPLSSDHRASSRTITLCGTIVPDEDNHELQWGAPVRDECQVCLKAAKAAGYLKRRRKVRA